jgi:HAD superfamily hydrolase (TIGR01509 family)
MTPPLIKAIIFDFDGLILDTESPDLHSWQAVYREHGVVFPLLKWVDALGRAADAFDPVGYLEAEVGTPFDREEIHARKRHFEDELFLGKSAMPGVERAIEEARDLGLRRAVASSSGRNWVWSHLDDLGLLASFDCIKCAEDVDLTKPAPDLYHAVLSELDLHGRDAIVLEDSPNGVRAAKAAGAFCVAVPNAVTASLDFAGADLQVASLAEITLERLIRRLGGRPVAASDHGDIRQDSAADPEDS